MAKSEIKIIIKAVDEASGAIRDIDGSLGSLQKAGIAGALALAAVAAAMGVIAVKAGKFIVESAKSAAEVQQLAGVNSILAKNAGIADKVVREQVKGLRAQGIEAAASEQAIARMMQAELDLSKATDLAKVAQDAAVISLSNSTETYDRLIHGITTLNPLVLRTAGITIDSATAFEKYASELGKSVSELTTTEKQQAFLNAVLEEGVKIQGAYDEAMENPIKQLGSMTRLMDDLKVALGEPFVGALGTVVSKMMEFATWLGGAVREGGSLYPIIEKLAKFAEDAAEAFAWMLDELMRVLDEKNTEEKASAVKKVWEDYYGPNGKITNIMNNFGLELEKIALIIKAAQVGEWEAVGAAIAATILSWSIELNNIWRGLIDGLVQIIKDIDWSTLGANIVRGIGNGIKSMFGWFTSNVSSPFSRIIAGMSSVGTSLVNTSRANPGWQTGGSFIVPGHGSGDRPYTLGLEPGERVTVTPRNQVGSGGGRQGLSLVVNINTPVNLADRSFAERELMPYIEAGVRQIMARTT